MTRISHRGIGKAAAAATAISMIAVVVGLGTVFESQGPPVTSTQSTSVASAQCAWSPTSVSVPGPVNATFAGCLMPGTSGDYLLGVTDPAGVSLTGIITSIYPMSVEINGSSSNNKVLITSPSVYGANDTASVSLPAISLEPMYTYAIIVRNQAVQNNAVTIRLQLDDTAASAGG